MLIQADVVIENKKQGFEYTTNPLTELPEGYELIETPSNATGTIEESNILKTRRDKGRKRLINK